MSFRIVLALCIFVGSCGESVPKSVTPAISGDMSECLKGYDQKIQNFFEGVNPKSDEMPKLLECYSGALTKFLERVKGQVPGEYKAEELKGFLEKFFLGDETLDHEFYFESLGIKSALFGGSDSILKRVELERTIQFVGILKEQVVSLQEFMPLTPERILKMPIEKADEAIIRLQAAGKAIAKGLMPATFPYGFDRLEIFLRRCEEVFTKGREDSALKQLRMRMPLLRRLKSTLVGPPLTAIQPEEWGELVESGFEWYSAFLKTRLLLDRFELVLSGKTLDRWMELVDQMLSLTQRALLQQPDRTLIFGDIDQLIDSIEKFSDYKLPLSPRTVKNSLRPFIRKLLGGIESGLAGRDAEGLTPDLIKRVSEGINRWARMQRVLDKVYLDLGSSDMKRSGEYSKENIRHGVSLYYSADRDEEFRDLNRVIDLPPLFRQDQWSVDLSEDVTQRGHSFHNLTIQNSVWQLFRWMISGYARDSVRAARSSAVNLEEWVSLYDDFRDFGIEMRLFDPRPFGDSPQSRYRDANLFSFSADRDPMLTIPEGTEIVSHMMSGKRLSGQLHRDSVKDCQNFLGFYLDPFGEKQVRAHCYRKNLYSNLGKYWKNLPLLKAYYEGLVPDEQKEFRINLEQAALRAGFLGPNDLINSIDSDAFALIGHYVETLFARFDFNHDGAIDAPEAELAFPIFKSTLLLMSPDPDPEFLKALFTYILAHGEIPESTWDKASFWWWKKNPGSWKFSSQRSTVLKIFAALKQPKSH